jgi:hypothetical protein
MQLEMHQDLQLLWPEHQKMNIPNLGDFVVCRTDIGYILGIYVRRIDHTTGAMGLCAEYVYERYRHRWDTTFGEWDDVPLIEMFAVAHPEKGFYDRGVSRFVAFCARNFPDTKWMTPKNTRSWLYDAIRRAGMRYHIMAYNLSRLQT